jgi:tetratricopeptide (TPR) repeat protein
MKQLLVLLIILLPFAGMAQKEVKPSIPKAEKALKDGKIDEAKAIIDVTTADPGTMVNKKGEPSKNAAKAWFLKGVIYAAIDTTKNEAFKSLEPNPFPIVKESFEKTKQLDPDAKFYISDATGLPILNENVYNYIAQAYFNKAISEYQENKDYKKALQYTEETMYFIPEDTSVLLNAGVYFAPAAEEFEKAEQYMKKYIEKGGKSSDPYIMLIGIYFDKKKDLDQALKYTQEAMAKFPNNPDFPQYELNIYVKQNRLPEARTAMEKKVKADPSDKESRYYLGVINMELKDYAAARKWYEESIKLDPQYFEPHLGLAELVYQDAKVVKDEMAHLGIKPEEKKKKLELDKVLVEKLKVALPYYEQCEKINPDEPKVLDQLYQIYRDLGMDAQVARVEKKMKTLGLFDN